MNTCTTLTLSAALTMVGCVSADCPAGTVLDETLDQCVRVVDMGVLDLGMDAAAPDMGDDLGPDLGQDLGACGACGTGTVCDPDSETCVECLTAADCIAPLGQCNAMHQCVACTLDDHCGGSTPYCVAETCVACRNNGDCPLTDPVCSTVDHTCGPCQQRSDCSYRSATPACNPSTGDCTLCDVNNESTDCPGQRCLDQTMCTECRPGTGNADCTTPSEPRCNLVGECAACTMDAHCSHIPGRPRCSGGTCVACTAATEGADCGGNTCSPATLTCTTTPRFSRSVCQSCVSDNDCAQTGGTFRCIPMNFQGTALGGFCLRATPGCTPPFNTGITATSLSGFESATYCGIYQNATSCDAVRNVFQSRQCPTGAASECMAPGALCETVGVVENRCTYACSTASACVPSGPASTCNAGYCGS
ncbi:MAG: hypothetical protein KC668_19990 [Myxococcales bacterium]|nr:hypothetical protein [Myxococcales bacterium]